jgi:hypothetical protein
MPVPMTQIEAFDPELSALLAAAYHCVIDFVLNSGFADGDPQVSRNIARHVVKIAQAGENNFLLLTNETIYQYRKQRRIMHSF